MLQRFSQLESELAASHRGRESGTACSSSQGVAPDAKFALVGTCDIPPAPPVAVGQLPVRLGVKIWGQLADTGQLINITKFRWNPKQRFWLWIEVAVPCRWRCSRITRRYAGVPPGLA